MVHTHAAETACVLRNYTLPDYLTPDDKLFTLRNRRFAKHKTAHAYTFYHIALFAELLLPQTSHLPITAEAPPFGLTCAFEMLEISSRDLRNRQFGVPDDPLPPSFNSTRKPPPASPFLSLALCDSLPFDFRRWKIATGPGRGTSPYGRLEPTRVVKPCLLAHLYAIL